MSAPPPGQLLLMLVLGHQGRTSGLTSHVTYSFKHAFHPLLKRTFQFCTLAAGFRDSYAFPTPWPTPSLLCGVLLASTPCPDVNGFAAGLILPVTYNVASARGAGSSGRRKGCSLGSAWTLCRLPDGPRALRVGFRRVTV